MKSRMQIKLKGISCAVNRGEGARKGWGFNAAGTHQHAAFVFAPGTRVPQSKTCFGCH